MNIKSLLQKTLENCPFLPYMGFSLLLAWLFLVCSDTGWLSDAETAGSNAALLFLKISCGAGVACLVIAHLPDKPRNAIVSPHMVSVSVAIVALCCFGIILGGPYYLWPYLPPIGQVLLSESCSYAIGLALAPLLLRCAELYGNLPPRMAIFYTALSHLFSAVVSYVIVGLPTWAPVPGGPPLSGILAFTLLPTLAALLINLKEFAERKGATASQESFLPSSKTQSAPSLSRFPRRLDKSFLTPYRKLLILVFVYAVVMMTVRATAMIQSPLLDATIDRTRLATFLHLLASLVFALAAIGASANFFNTRKLYSVIVIATIATIVALPFVGVQSTFLVAFVVLLDHLFDLVLWYILSFTSYQKKAVPSVTFGLACGLYYLGIVVGWLLSTNVFIEVQANGHTLPLYLGLALAVLVCAFVLFSEREFDKLFDATDENTKNLAELRGMILKEENSSDTPKKGHFTQVLEGIAAEYQLSSREGDVFRYLAMGHDATAIAEKLVVSYNTARTHIRNIYAKLGVHTRRELIALIDAKAKEASE